MAEEPVNLIRENTRNQLRLNRQTIRDKQTDCHRPVHDIKTTPATVIEISNKLKNKSSITESELDILKNALIDNPSYIEIVLRTQGSLRGLVRELSGSDVKRQFSAAGCCCNLGLGDSKACVAVAKAAGSYLVAALDNLSTELAVTCAWSLGNMAGSGPGACDTLVVQGAVSKLINLVHSNNQDMVDAALYALVHFAYQLKDDFSPEYVEKVVQAYPKLGATLASSQLLFILSCHGSFIEHVSEEFLTRLLENFTMSIKVHCGECAGAYQCCPLLYLIRTIANTCDPSISECIVNYFETNNIGEYLKVILRSDNKMLIDSLLWLLGDLYNCCGQRDLFMNLAINV